MVVWRLVSFFLINVTWFAQVLHDNSKIYMYTTASVLTLLWKICLCVSFFFLVSTLKVFSIVWTNLFLKVIFLLCYHFIACNYLFSRFFKLKNFDNRKKPTYRKPQQLVTWRIYCILNMTVTLYTSFIIIN